MLDIKLFRERPDDVRQALRRRRSDFDIEPILALDQERRGLLTEVEMLKNQRNVVSRKIPELKKAGQDIAPIQHEMRMLGDRIAAMDARIREMEEQLTGLLLRVPNLPHVGVHDGASGADNRVVRTWGEIPATAFEPKPHWEVAERLGLIDFDRGVKISGAGFPLFIGAGARLERALINFMLDVHVSEQGYREVSPPFVVNTASMTGTGQLPKMAEDMYHAKTDDLWLIPTAEVPVTNIYRDEILRDPLPIRLTAYTPCFRREAGAAGRETRGLIRVHQFDKVEMVKFVEPDASYDELESLVNDAEAVLQRLELPYRVVQLCTGDLSFAAAKCYDIELWAPAQKAWLEVSSCSNFEDFQARRASIRYKNKEGKTAFVHTLNGSGVACPRLMVAILENYQQADGSVVIPRALQPYMGGMERIT